MFDQLPETRKAGDRRRRIPLALAGTVHLVAATALLSVSALAVEPLDPPREAAVYVTVVLPPAPPGLPPAGRPAPPKDDRPAPASKLKPPVQPREIPRSSETPSTSADPGADVPRDSGPDGPGSNGPEAGPGGPGDSPGGPDGPPGGLDPGTVYRPAPEVVPPVVIEQVMPRYPEIAKAAGRTGTVILQAIIDTTGGIENVEVIRGDPLLDRAAVEAVRKWRFRPARLNGRPVKAYFTLTVNFTLR